MPQKRKAAPVLATRGRGRPPDPWKRQQKLLLLVVTALQLPPVRSLAELKAAIEERLNDPGKWKSKGAALRSVAEQLDLTEEAMDRFVWPRRKGKAKGAN